MEETIAKKLALEIGINVFFLNLFSGHKWERKV